MALYLPDEDISADDLIDDLGRLLAERYQNAEDELVREIAQRAYRDVELQAKLRQATDADRAGLQYALNRNKQLAELAGHRAHSIRDLQYTAVQVVGRIRDEGLAREVIDAAATKGEAEAAAQLGMARRLPKTTALNANSTSATAQLTLSLQSRLEAMNQRITRYPVDAYQRIVSLTSPNVLLGATSQMLAQRDAVQRFLSEGITGFTDVSGRNWRIGTYAEMAGRTSVARAFNDAGIYRMQQSGLNLVTPVGSLSSCPRCAPWVGKTLSTDGTTGEVTLPNSTLDGDVTIVIDGTVQQARDGGLGHPNCTHKFVAVLPGQPNPQAGFKYDEKADKARERQRELEVDIRAAKRDLATAGDDMAAQKARREIKETQQSLRDHLDATGRKRNSAREQLAFADGTGGPIRPNPAPTPKPKGPRPGPDVLIAKASKLGQDVREGLASIRKVHTLPNSLPNLPIVSANLGAGTNGVYKGGAGILQMSPKGLSPTLTTAHEMGHYLDHQLLGTSTKNFESRMLSDPLTQSWLAAAQATPEAARLRAILNDTRYPKGIRDHADYLLQPVELWGRSYAQWVATRSASAQMLDEVAAYRASVDEWTANRQWGTPEFEPVASAIDAIFRAKGLLK